MSSPIRTRWLRRLTRSLAKGMKVCSLSHELALRGGGEIVSCWPFACEYWGFQAIS
jgi:hypothetical protein